MLSAAASKLGAIRVIILFGITTFVLYVVFFRMASRWSLSNSVRPKKTSTVPAEFQAQPRAVMNDDAVIVDEQAWTALDDHQLERLLKDSSP
jgi:hypothetical protein